jgi:hypothetical protein
MRRNEEDAPIPAVRMQAGERVKSTHTGRSLRPTATTRDAPKPTSTKAIRIG